MGKRISRAEGKDTDSSRWHRGTHLHCRNQKCIPHTHATTHTHLLSQCHLLPQLLVQRRISQRRQLDVFVRLVVPLGAVLDRIARTRNLRRRKRKKRHNRQNINYGDDENQENTRMKSEVQKPISLTRKERGREQNVLHPPPPHLSSIGATRVSQIIQLRSGAQQPLRVRLVLRARRD